MSPSDLKDLDPLQEAYDLIAELRVSPGARAFIGKRREDGTDVLVTIYRSPEGEDRNGLTHLAADVRLLATLRHRHLVPVLEGRWLGSDAFAVVTARVAGSTVQELASRGDAFSSPRIAAILREVNGVLAWARDQKVVHRTVTPATVLLEPGTDHVLCSFVMRAIGLAGAPGQEGDAQSIAALAFTMFTREHPPLHTEDAGVTLAERRADLPKRVADETEAMLGWTVSSDRTPDVPGYIALIAMADALKTAEIEAARLEAEKLEEQRAARADLAAQRSELERWGAEQAQELERKRLDLERATAKNRDELAALDTAMKNTVSEERKQLARDREALLGTVGEEREQIAALGSAQETAVAQERQQMAARRADLERSYAQEVQALAARRAELEETVAAEREELAAERARLAGAGRAGRRVSDVATFEAEVPVTLSAMADATAPGGELGGGPAGSMGMPSQATVSGEAEGSSHSQRRKSVAWVVPGAAVILVALFVATALGVGARRRSFLSDQPTNPALSASLGFPGQLGTAPPAHQSVVDSAGGGVAGASKSADSLSSVVPLPARQTPLILKRKKTVRPSDAGGMSYGDSSRTARTIDSATAARDTVANGDSLLRPKRDSALRRDTLPKRDTLRTKRDTLAKPDTVP